MKLLTKRSVGRTARRADGELFARNHLEVLDIAVLLGIGGGVVVLG
jgi:hypothetical protein